MGRMACYSRPVDPFVAAASLTQSATRQRRLADEAEAAALLESDPEALRDILIRVAKALRSHAHLGDAIRELCLLRKEHEGEP